jgi:hypothetical protein
MVGCITELQLAACVTEVSGPSNCFKNHSHFTFCIVGAGDQKLSRLGASVSAEVRSFGRTAESYRMCQWPNSDNLSVQKLGPFVRTVVSDTVRFAGTAQTHTLCCCSMYRKWPDSDLILSGSRVISFEPS